jgi:hypothetical protein
MPIVLCLSRLCHRNLGAAFLALVLAGTMLASASAQTMIRGHPAHTGVYALE